MCVIIYVNGSHTSGVGAVVGGIVVVVVVCVIVVVVIAAVVRDAVGVPRVLATLMYGVCVWWALL